MNARKQAKIIERLKSYTWEELDWLERTVRKLKGSAPGIRFHRINDQSDYETIHQASESLQGFFDDAAAQHGIY